MAHRSVGCIKITTATISNHEQPCGSDHFSAAFHALTCADGVHCNRCFFGMACIGKLLGIKYPLPTGSSAIFASAFFLSGSQNCWQTTGLMYRVVPKVVGKSRISPYIRLPGPAGSFADLPGPAGTITPPISAFSG
jgi:hypothetical protein